MKIAFVNSFFLPLDDIFPIGLLSLCSVLKEHNIHAQIIDFNNLNEFNNTEERYNISKFGDYILKENFDIISFYTMANSYHISILIAEYIKLKNKNLTIILAGPQASVCAEDTLSYFPFIDFISIGEGETTIYQIIKSILDKNYTFCPNIVYRLENTINFNELNPLIENLDNLPYLDYDLIPNIKTFSRIPIEVGRGCPFSCEFCSTKSFWKQNYRLKSNERIISEIKYIKEKRGINNFNFEHDSLTANRKKILSFCNAIIENKLDIVWGCSSRIDVLDENLIVNLKNAGCKKIFMGIETGSPKMQKIINKNLKLEKIWDVVHILQNYKIEGVFSFIYGFPEETPEDLSLTLDIIISLMDMGVKNIQFHKLCVLRGTEFYSKYNKNLVELDTQLTSNFNTGGNANNFINIIKKYPSIFPHYYKLNNTVKDIDYLEIFVNLFLKILHISYPYTYKYLSKYFSKNIFSFYLELYNYYEDLENKYNEFISGNISNEILSKTFLNVLKNYLNTNNLKKDILLQMIFKFEEDYIKWFSSTEETCEKDYEIDIYKYIMNNNNYENIDDISYPIHLQFKRKDNKYFIKRLNVS